MKETRNVHINVTSNASKNLKKGSVAAKGMSGSLKGVAASANLATGGIRAMATALLTSGVGAFVVALGALGAGFMGLIGRSKEFATSLSTLGAISGASGKELESLKANAKALGSSTAFTAKEVLELSTELAKLGFDAPMIVSASKGILDLAAAAGTDLASAASIAAGTLRGFGLDASETGRVADVMANSFSSSGLDIEKFRESMKLVAPIAKVTNVSLEQTTAALSVLADRQISGSMAGTQLRRIMSDLAMKTGKDFQTSLDITAERLAEATSSSEKLAIAKELVGDRAKGSLIALAENRGEVSRLAEAYEEVGVAGDKAEKMLDNLEGDSKKLSSAWEGLMLSIEDGDGILTGVARGGVQFITSSIEFFRVGMTNASIMWEHFTTDLKKAVINFGNVGDKFKLMSLKIQEGFIKIKEFGQGIPLIGDNISQSKIDSQKKAILKGYEDITNGVLDRSKRLAELDKERNENIKRILVGDVTAVENANKKIFENTVETGESITEETKKRLKEEKAIREEFIKKFRKLEEDADDKSNADKIRRKKERHLKELDGIVMESKAKAKLKADIELYYEGLLALDKQKAIDKLKGKLEADDALSKNEKRRSEHLAELEAIEMEETEKAELRKRINDYYDKEGVIIQKGIDDGKLKDAQAIADEEERIRQQKIAGMYGVLDTAADIAGQETEIARALQAIKLAMQLSELGVKMGILKKSLFASAQAAVQEATIEGAKVGTATAKGMAETSKVGFPWNIVSMAGYALQAASLVKSFSASKKKLTSVTAKAGVGGGGSEVVKPQAPSFNVIGATSAGDNMIADTIAGVNDRPMRAYVVEGDVSTRQSLTRNARSLASI